MTVIECEISLISRGNLLFLESINRVDSNSTFSASLLLYTISRIFKDQDGFEGNALHSSIPFWQRLGAVLDERRNFILKYSDLEKYFSSNGVSLDMCNNLTYSNTCNKLPTLIITG